MSYSWFHLSNELQKINRRKKVAVRFNVISAAAAIICILFLAPLYIHGCCIIYAWGSA